ncbi:MAG: HEAT repeat domain-containing protein [Thermoleophilia bacterium]|nr:HEAT repeat domain-containing protein [Thermoleophilia bacterium]
MLPPIILIGVLAATVLIGIASLLALSATKLRWKIKTRSDARHRHDLRVLPIALAGGRVPSPAPVSGRGREVALEMMVETVARLRGRHRIAAQMWFEGNGYVDEAIRELRSKSGWRRAQAAYRMGRFGSARAEAYLAWRLRDPRYEVRDAAARALGRVGGRDAIGPLLDAAEQGRVARGLVSGALLELPPGCDHALASAMNGRETDTRRLIAQVIGLRGRPVGDVLVTGLRDDEPEVRRESALALARLGEAPGEAEIELRRLARDERPWVRASAATALGALLGDRAARSLAELAGDEDFWVGYRAAEALTELPSGAEHGWRVLMTARDTASDRRSRRRCLELMEQRGQVQERLQASVERGGRDLDQLLEALARAGSRAWPDAPR